MKPPEASAVRRHGSRARFFLRRVRAYLGRGIVVRRPRIFVADDGDRCRSPILIVGAHRSGTSLLRRVLDSHPNIACPPESFFLRHYEPLVEDPETFVGLANLGFDRDQALAGLGRGAAYFHEAYRRAKGKARWADKTPGHVFHLDALEQLFQGRCQYVATVRHPLDVAYSIHKRGWRLGDYDRDLLINTCRYVEECLARQTAFAERCRERWHTVYYDRLVRRPRETLQELCDFLGEPWSDALLRHADQPHDFGTEDPVARGLPGFRGSFGNWHGWAPDELAQAQDLLAATVERLGYSTRDAFCRGSVGVGEDAAGETT